MIWHLLFANAVTYIMIRDKSKTPLNSTKPFETAQQQLLYNMLQQNMAALQETDDIGVMLKELWDFYYLFKVRNGREPSREAIKTQMVYNISKKFGIDPCISGVSELAENFDEHLVHHLKELGQSGFNSIIKAVKLDFSEYSRKEQYRINQSVSYIMQTHIALSFDMLNFLVKRGQWSWTENNEFEKHIKKYIPDVRAELCCIFESGHDHVDIDFDISHAFTPDNSLENALKDLEIDPKKEYIVYSLYTLRNVVKTVEQYTSIGSSKKLEDLTTTETRDLLVQNLQLETLHNLLVSILVKECVSTYKLYHPIISNYELFFNLKPKDTECYKLKHWKRDIANMRNRIANIIQNIQEWLDFVNLAASTNNGTDNCPLFNCIECDISSFDEKESDCYNRRCLHDIFDDSFTASTDSTSSASTDVSPFDGCECCKTQSDSHESLSK